MTTGAGPCHPDGVRLLVVEDEARMAAALRRGLVAEGFVVDVAADGAAGLEAALYQDYDAMIVDVMLPVMSGYRLVERLREAGRWVPILMLSAKNGEHDQAEGLDCGADDYLTKPFSYLVLLARVRALLRRGTPARPSVLAAGDITLDPASRRVRRAGADVDLTVREFALLEYLIRRPGEVVSKTELLDHVFDAGEDTGANLVEVYVGYLRRKLGAHAVETVRGAGYRVADG